MLHLSLYLRSKNQYIQFLKESDKGSYKSLSKSIDGTKDVRLDIPSLASTIQGRLNASPVYSESRCIFRVPTLLRQTNEKAYTPALVSIGPLHYNNERLLPMEAHKVKYRQSFLRDPDANTAEHDLLNLCLGIVLEEEARIRDCYADPINLSSKEFCEMVLVDSAFIIQLFRKLNSDKDDGGYMYGKPNMALTVCRDIWLEENQLPFFILDKLYCAAFQTNTTGPNVVPSFTEIACEFLQVNRGSKSNVGETDYLHLLHMIIFHHSPATGKTIKRNKKDVQDCSFPAATQLREAGVKFQVNNHSSTSLDIEFDKVKGILKMPRLTVADQTEYQLRNLIAFEQCNYTHHQTRYFSDYQYFLDYLIHSPEDVQLLIEADIIKNIMGSPEDVSYIINSLGTNVHPSCNGYYYYADISSDLKEYCKKWWPRHRATLMHKYLNHP